MQEWLGLPVQASAHAAEIDQMTILTHWLMLFLFVGWGVYFIYALVRFRKKANPKADYHGIRSHFSNYLEIGVAVFEAVLLIAFGTMAGIGGCLPSCSLSSAERGVRNAEWKIPKARVCYARPEGMLCYSSQDGLSVEVHACK